MSWSQPAILVAAGAILAAIIGAAASFISLVNQKEQKTSEFRQAWIDSLREDLAEFLGSIEGLAIELAAHLEHADAEFLKRTAERYASVRGTLARILLRLNPDEHHDLEVLLRDADKTLHQEAHVDVLALRSLRENIVGEARRVLKKEWIRVKTGEATFRLTKRLALGLLIALISGAWWLMHAAQQAAEAVGGGR